MRHIVSTSAKDPSCPKNLGILGARMPTLHMLYGIIFVTSSTGKSWLRTMPTVLELAVCARRVEPDRLSSTGWAGFPNPRAHGPVRENSERVHDGAWKPGRPDKHRCHRVECLQTSRNQLDARCGVL